MKKIYSFLMVSAIAMTANAQTLINENFSGYTTPNLGSQGTPAWVPGNGNPDVQVATGTPLTYPGYPSGTQYITVSPDNGKDPYKPFFSSVTTTGTMYMSFVVRASDAAGTGSAVYSVALGNSGNSNDAARFFIGENTSDATKIQFGIAVGDNLPPTYTSTTYSYNTTYLILIRYDIINGTGNDNAWLWVNPSLAQEPSTTTADATNINGEVAFGSFNALKLFQSSNTNSPDAAFDAFNVAFGASSLAAWANLGIQSAPLPVQLTSFNAAQDGLNNTKLVWNTAEENGITSYVVERSSDGRNFTAIGTVPAAGQKTYSFTDKQTASDHTYYRLKMVETDGTYKLSFIVSLKSMQSLNISLSPNPVKNNLLIQHPKVNMEGRIQIVNMNGQLIKDLRLPASSVITNIDLSGFANGMYHVVFRNGADIFTKMVLKN